MNNQNIQNKLTSDKATLQRRYNTLAGGLKIEGVDVKAIKSMMSDISDKMQEIDRQYNLVS